MPLTTEFMQAKRSGRKPESTHASRFLRPSLVLVAALVLCAQSIGADEVYRVTTVSPFPRGIAVKDGEMFILSRGRVRGAGGVSAEVNDNAGTIYRIDRDVLQPISEPDVSEEVRVNGDVFAAPTDPPFRLWDVNADPPYRDRETVRPYCGLRWHEASKSFYICAYSGVDKPRSGPGRTFSKNLTDAILRYDTRTETWSEVERHDIEAGGIYPHHDPTKMPPPHGWINGPDNLLPVGNWLYAVAKDNSGLVRYDLTAYITDPSAGAAPSEWLLDDQVETTNAGRIEFLGHSALAYRDGWLYVSSRTSSHIIRMRLDKNNDPVFPYEMELLALFDPWTFEKPKPADLTDMAFDSRGRLYVVSAKPSRVFRFTPDPENIYDARDGKAAPWRDFSALTENPTMKSENLFIDENDELYVTSGDGYDFQYGAAGTVYRTRIDD